jgi:hypothetical protein
MEGYEKKNHGDVKTQETIMMGNLQSIKTLSLTRKALQQ